MKRAAPAAALLLISACASPESARSAAEHEAPPAGYVLVADERLPVTVPVVTFLDAGGFDARTETRWFDPSATLPRRPAKGCNTVRRHGMRKSRPPFGREVAPIQRSPESAAAMVDQLVLHYDAAVTSTRCFDVLHDLRGLSSHFLLDLDGTLYQTLDLMERARHAGAANDRSIGIEIAHPGAYEDESEVLAFYEREGNDFTLAPPPLLAPPPGGPFRPARPGLFRDTINGREVVQPDYTEAQYRTLERLLPALRGIFAELTVVGHHHLSQAKVDPGPAFHWERVLRALAASRAESRATAP